MKIVKLNDVYAKIKFTDQESAMNLPAAIYEHFSTYVKNYKFMPKYKNGDWDGMVHHFHKYYHTIKLGLLSELEDYVMEEFPDVVIEGYSKSLDNDIVDNILQLPNSNFKYYDDQLELITVLLRHRYGVIESATGSGKSVMIAGIIYNIMNQRNIKDNIILVVPTIDLVMQMYNDFLDYGFDENLMGRVGGKYKEFGKPITITTWQSCGSHFMKKKVRKKSAKSSHSDDIDVKNYFRYALQLCEVIIFDECHLVHSNVLSKISEAMKNTQYRIGVTGTLPSDKNEFYSIVGNIGELLGTNSISSLIEKGRLADVFITQYMINYPKQYKNKTGINEYNDLVEYIEKCSIRKKLIHEILNKPDVGASLVLVQRVSYGQSLYEQLTEQFPNKSVFFVYGGADTDYRTNAIETARDTDDVIIIATVKLFQMGINIKRLKTLVFAHIGKSEIAVFQSIGRTTRKFGGKIANIVDIGSNLKFDNVHANKRMEFYQRRLQNRAKRINIG